jgi:hypothetical protein
MPCAHATPVGTRQSRQAARSADGFAVLNSAAPLVATMAVGSTGYEPIAWWLAREGIGQSLRQRYAVAEELPPSSSTPFSKLDVLKVISCYSHVVNAIDAGDTNRGLKGVRASTIKSERGAMRGFHHSSFDPQTLALIETAFDEAWLTLKSVGNKTVKSDELARSVLRLAMEGERDPVRLHDEALERLLPSTGWREAS